MSQDNIKTSLYLHKNDSSLSSLPSQRMPVQVSSVGFNTLKKQPTNVSVSSDATTINTLKSNSLARFFTRNRSSSTINEGSDVVLTLDLPGSVIGDDTSSSHKGLFKLSRKQPKFKITNKSMSKPDLTIQTTGHHALKVPKKLLSSSSVDEYGKKTAPSPISLNHIFHRPHGQSKADSIKLQEDGSSTTKLFNSLPHRTSVSLSSQSSNSFVSDLNSAILFNFTDPNFMVNSADGNTDLPAILEIHRKYLVSTDQFMQSKLHRSMMDSPNPLNTEQDKHFTDDDLPLTPIESEKKYSQIFSDLFAMMHTLFIPSSQTTLSNGRTAPQLPLTMEHAANFVRQKLVKNLLKEQEMESLRRTEKGRSSLIVGIDDDSSLKENINDAVELKKKELIQELCKFFEKCCSTIAKDKGFNSSVNETGGKRFSETMITRTQSQNQNTKGLRLNEFLHEWEIISDTWQYFNKSVRYYLLNVFYPLQLFLNEEENQNGKKGTNQIRVESLLLKAFRDAVIMPHLNHRGSEISKSPFPMETTKARTIPSSLYPEEKTYFQSRPDVFKTLKKCFGIIRSHLKLASGNSDDQLVEELAFEEFVHGFNLMSR